MKQLYLIRGIPGSGKSTFAKLIKDVNGENSKHFEADQFFVKDNNYKFDASKIQDAHDWCKANTDKSLEDDCVVIVSNTFTTKKELKPYFEIAKKHNLVPEVITIQSQHNNTHNVPEEKLNAMRSRFEYDLTELFND